MAEVILKSGDDATGLLEYCSINGPGVPLVSLESDRADSWDRAGAAKWVSYTTSGRRGSKVPLTGSLDRRLETPMAHFFRKFSFPETPTEATLTVWCSGLVSCFLGPNEMLTAPNNPKISKEVVPGLMGGSIPTSFQIQGLPKEGWLRFDTFQVEDIPFGLRWILEVVHP